MMMVMTTAKLLTIMMMTTFKTVMWMLMSNAMMTFTITVDGDEYRDLTNIVFKIE